MKSSGSWQKSHTHVSDSSFARTEPLPVVYPLASKHRCIILHASPLMAFLGCPQQPRKCLPGEGPLFQLPCRKTIQTVQADSGSQGSRMRDRDPICGPALKKPLPAKLDSSRQCPRGRSRFPPRMRNEGVSCVSPEDTTTMSRLMSR